MVLKSYLTLNYDKKTRKDFLEYRSALKKTLPCRGSEQERF